MFSCALAHLALVAALPSLPRPVHPCGNCWDPEAGACTSPEPIDCMTPIHAILLSTGVHKGKVLLVDGLTSTGGIDGVDASRPDIALFDPINSALSEVWDSFEQGDTWPSFHRLYCSGHSVLPDGKVIFRGGDQTPGNPTLSIYDQVSGNAGFVLGPDETIDFLQYQDKPTFRWYPTLTALADGRVLITDGWEKANMFYPAPTPQNPNPPPVPLSGWPHGNSNIPVIFDPATSAYEALNNAEYCQQTANGPNPGFYWENCNAGAPNVFNMEEYPWMFLLSNGKVFYARSQYGIPSDTGSFMSRTLDPALEQWATVDIPDTPQFPNGVFGGCAVMYAKDRIL